MTGAESAAEPSSGFALIEMLFSFGVVLVIAVWQWWQVRKSSPGDTRRVNDQEESDT